MSLPRTESERNYTYNHEKYGYDENKKSAGEIFNNCAVSCDSVISSAVGKKILEQDGSAVDAAIGTLLCNSLLNAQSMGIGGGFLMLHYSKKDEKITVFDARETAPALSSFDMFKYHSKTKGGISIATPGEVKGYWQAHQMFGNLKWSKLFQPAIEMCNNGFPLPYTQAKYLSLNENHIRNSPSLRETFLNKLNNEIYTTNSIIKRPRLGKTLEIIAKQGADAFYNGELSETIVDEIQSNGGIVTKADLQNYECLIKKPVTFSLKDGVELNSVPNPGCGVLLNFILGILDSFDHDRSNSVESNALFYHRFIEACKFGFGLRYLIGDDNFDDSTDLYKTLSDQNIINEYKERISETNVFPSNYYGSKGFNEDHGTAHTSIVAPNGDAVAITSSINLVFGSNIAGAKTDIIYNNQMDDFACPDTECNSYGVPNYSANFIQPGKRPVSSMTPLIAINPDKNVRLVSGASGGTRILTSTALTAAHNLILKRDILESIENPRIHQQLWPDEVLYEDHFDREVIYNLSNTGHNLINFGHGGSSVQAIAGIGNGQLHAVCDVRKGGKPYGF